jgi:hypothetical protein
MNPTESLPPLAATLHTAGARELTAQALPTGRVFSSARIYLPPIGR